MPNDNIQNDKSKISFTIVTPVFNRANCIRRCIESVIAQNYADLEHWIVDDGSTDNTFEIVQEYASAHSWIKCHKYEKNRGVNAARNYGIQSASNNYILFLDSDDYLVDNALYGIKESIYSNPGYLHYLFAQDDRMPFYNQNPLLNQKDQVELNFSIFLAGQVHLDFVHVMASGLVKEFPFDESLRIYESLNFFRIYKKGERQLFTKKVVSMIERGRADSVTNEGRLTNGKALKKQYTYLRQKLFLFEKDYLQHQAKKAMADAIIRAFVLGTAVGEYEDNKILIDLAQKYNVHIPYKYRLISALRFGFLIRYAIFSYSRIKRIFKL